MRAELEKADGFLMLSPDADELEKFRFSICQNLLKYSNKKKFKDSEMAKFLEITKVTSLRF